MAVVGSMGGTWPCRRWSMHPHPEQRCRARHVKALKCLEAYNGESAATERGCWGEGSTQLTWLRSKLSALVSSFVLPTAPLEPNSSTYTFASVPAPLQFCVT